MSLFTIPRTKTKLFGLFFFFLILPSATWAEVKILNMRWLETSQDKQQLVFDLSQPAQYKLFTLRAEGEKPHRVVIDFSDTEQVSDLIDVPSSIPMLKNLRSGKRNQGKDLRVVLDVAHPVHTRSFLLKPSGRNGHRLIVTIAKPRHDLLPSAQIAQVNELPAQIQSPSPSLTPIYSTPLTPIPLPRSRSHKRQMIVAIDAGHGGIDPGAIGQRGSYEKNVVLAIARELAYLVRQDPDMGAAMIRNDDSYLKLRERIERARQYQADLFISIHADAYEKDAPQIHGSSVYILSQRGASSEAARWLAEKENAADLLGGVSLNDKNDTLASILLDLSQTGTLEASGRLAQHVLSGLSDIGPVHHKKVQQAAFMVLRSPDIPSILIETAFISNPTEERKLNSKQYQRNIAKAIFQGIKNYVKHYPAPSTQVAQH